MQADLGLHCPQITYGPFSCIAHHILIFFFFELGFNDTSTLVGYFVSSPREREKKDKKIYSGGDQREGQGKKENE